MGRHPAPPTIPGVKAEGPLLHTLQKEVATLLGRDSLKFAGAQPVSFAARHLAELQKQDYYVCEKSDGIRCLMYLTNDGDREVVYLIDRKNDYYWVEDLHFPLPSDERQFHIGTIVDGELVNDAQPDGSVQLHYLVFDCLMLDSSSLMSRTLDKRLAYFRTHVYIPYAALYEKYPQEKAFLPFTVQFKGMELSYGTEKLFRETLPNLPHGNDGLIFTCVSTPYKFGTDPHILKWKSANENSVDFVLSLEWPVCEVDSDDEANGVTAAYPDYTVIPTCHLFVLDGSDYYRPYGQMHVSPEEWEHIKSLQEPMDEAIVECYQDHHRRWRFMRLRNDKLQPNHISVVESVMESISDRIEEKDLIGAARAIRNAWKRRHPDEHKAPTMREVSGPKRKREGVEGEGLSELAKRRLQTHSPSPSSTGATGGQASARTATSHGDSSMDG